MTLSITCDKKPEFHFKYRALASRVVETVLKLENFPFEAEVSLTLTDNVRIQKMNFEMRGINRATDVLSFPMLEYAFPADYGGIKAQWEFAVNPDTGEILLGDIVISIDKVREQAGAYGHSERREYAFLIAHSMLHLLGYDHMESDDAAVMEEHQRVIMQTLGIAR